MTLKTAAHALVGAIVRDITVTDERVRYLVGKDGFMTLGTGDFTPYDSAFNGPEFFAGEAFEIEYDERRKMSDDAAEVLDTLHWRYTRFAEATTPVTQAHALVGLHDAMSDMISWHPDYEFEHEGAFMPWQRNEQD